MPSPVVEPPEPVVLSARPNDRMASIHGFQKADDLAIGEMLAGPKAGPLAILEVLDTIAAGAEPHTSIFGRENSHHPGGHRGPGHGYRGPIPTVEAHRAILRGDPEIALGIEGDGFHGILGKAILVGVDADGQPTRGCRIVDRLCLGHCELGMRSGQHDQVDESPE